MLAIRMQRTGRKGHAMFRVVVQDSRRSPSSGKVVAFLGSFDPHSKKIVLDKDKAGYYLEHGAQPSERVVRILKEEKVKLPAWVNDAKKKSGSVRNPDKRRSTAPVEEKAAEETTAETKDAAVEAPAEEKVEDNNQASEKAAEEEAPETSEESGE